MKKNLFAGNNKVKKITIDVTYIKSVGRHAFYGISKNAVINLKGSKRKIEVAKALIKKSGIPSYIRIKS